VQSTRKAGAVVGTFFLIALVADLAGGELLERVIHAPDYLSRIYLNKTQVIMGMLLELIAAAAIVGIAVTIFPILRRHSERIALGYLGLRIIEAVTLVVYVFSLPSLMILSQEYAKAGSPDASYFQSLGASLLAESYWVYPMLVVFFGLSALLFYYLLYRSRLIPRFISAWGFLAIVLLLTGSVIGMFSQGEGYSVVPKGGIIMWAAPIALNEVFLAIWLIVRGFNSSKEART
jgi:hypothetical protein